VGTEGLTSVDSLFEMLGMRAGGRMADFSYAVWLPALIALASIAWLYVRSIERGLIRPVVFYFFYAVFIGFLAGPTAVTIHGLKGPETFNAPRLAFHLNRLCDSVTAGVSNNFDELRSQMDEDQAAFVLEHVRIADSKLREAARQYIKDCLAPELAARAEKGEDIGVYLINPFFVLQFRVQTSSTGTT
jgi:hypothetical protein